MVKKSFMNSEIVMTINKMNDEIGSNIAKKRLPIKLIYAMKKSLPEMFNAYKPFEEARDLLYQQYDVQVDEETSKFKISDEKKANAFLKEFDDLLNMKIDVNIETVSMDVIELCDEERYDSLTYEEADRIWWLIEEDQKNEKQNEQPNEQQDE